MSETHQLSSSTINNKLDTLCGSLPGLETCEALPEWGKVMLQSIKSLCIEIKIMNENISKRLDFLEVRNRVNDQLKKSITITKKELESDIRHLEEVIDDQQQYSRRNCLLIHGIEENEGENVDDLVQQTIANQLMIDDISINDIDRTHRIGNKTSFRGRVTRNNKPKVRAIIVKFVSYRKRRKVFYAKKMLKNSGIVITESLTAKRLELLKAAQLKYGFRNIWTSDGQIMGKVDNDFFLISNYADII